MVLGDAGWDKKESPESNLHMCGKDDIKIIVYNMERCTKKRGLELLDNWILKRNHMIQVTEALPKIDF